MKSSLALAFVLLFASAAHAQASARQPLANGSIIGGGLTIPSWGTGGAWSSINSPIGRPVIYELPREYTLEYATNDGPFIPTVYMNYEEALALGRQQLAAAEKEATEEPAVSLGEAARTLRAEKLPTLRLRSRALQDNAGKLHICNLNGRDCRPL